VDTSHLVYPLNRGTTDGHVHEYDDKYNVTAVNLMAFRDNKLDNIQARVPAGTYFKLIISNPNLSPGVVLSINGAATLSSIYKIIPVSGLPLYTTDGRIGSTRLTQLSINFVDNKVSGVINTVTSAVRGNKPGRNGEARNGAFTIQAVRCNANGSPAFTTNPQQSAGGQGFAATGLLWECTVFWHWDGKAYGENGWYPYPQ
jgi:hypothetical protein